MSEQTIALVTGANKGIGYEIAAGLGALGWKVGVGARNDERREAAVAKLREGGADAFFVSLDVTDDASVTVAAALIEQQAGGLDVLVNNAGITGGGPQAPTTVDPATMRAVVETNVIGVIRVTNAMLPMLRRSPSPRIVNVHGNVDAKWTSKLVAREDASGENPANIEKPTPGIEPGTPSLRGMGKHWPVWVEGRGLQALRAIAALRDDHGGPNRAS